jgi:GEVED domain/Secretion system C-terminal sorting domain
MKKHLLHFKNIGFAALTALAIGQNSNAQILYDNGPYFNSAGTGAAGANESILLTTTFGMGTIGFGHQASALNRVADDFISDGCAWKIDSIVFFGYQTGSTTTSTFTAVNFRIWNGVPNAPGSTVVFGDTTTNRLTRTVWSGAYRITETTIGNTSRPIMRNVCSVSALTLSADTFWLDWQSAGSLASGPWAPARTPIGQNITGNGRQRTGATWSNAIDGGTGNPAQGFPFIIYGSKVTLSANAGLDIALCNNSTTVIGGAPAAIGGAGSKVYSWSPANNLSNAAIANPQLMVNNIASSSYILTVTDSIGCQSKDTIAVSVNTLPIVTSAAPAAICSGSNTGLNAVASAFGVYCQPTYSTGTVFGDYISRVQLNSLFVNSVGAASPFYTLYPDTGAATTSLAAGATDTIRLRAGTYTQNDFAVWIDYNQNGNFEVSEKLGEVLDLGIAPAEGKIGFTVPVTALNGKTRLRVRELDGAAATAIDPCTVQSLYGEVEDYTVTITGGINNPSITYAWSPATFLSSTSVSNPIVTAATATTIYTVIANAAGGCADTTNVTVTVNALPTVTANASSAAVCAGGAVTLSGGGATSYTWNNGVTNGVLFIPASTNTYIVTGIGANTCSNTASITIPVNALPTVTASASSSSICAGQSTTLSGGGAVSYSWNNGVTNGVSFAPATTLTYTVTGTDANTCSNTATQTVTVNANPVASLTAPVSVLCTGTPATLTGLPSGGTYSVVSGSSSALSGNTFNASNTGNYTIAYTFTNAANCSDSAQFNFNVNCILGLDNTIINNSSFIIFPNPNNGVFTISSNIEVDGTVELINELGQVVYKNRMNGLVQQLDVQHLAAGVYHLKVLDNGKVITKRLSIVK